MTTVLIFRLLHVLTGAFWAGTLLFAAVFLLPSLRAVGPAGGQVMGQLAARRYPITLAIAGLTTVISGGWMYWHDDSISAGAFGRSRSGMAFNIGGLAAIIALGVGLSMITPTAGKLARIGATVQARGGPPTPEEASEIARLQGRMTKATQAAAVLIAIALITMAIGRYV